MPRVAELYLSTEVSGFVEPCGCTSRPLGGVQRLATAIKRGYRYRALIDAGDLFFPPEGLGDETADQHRLKAQYLARVYRQLGAIALNVGPSDLAAGANVLVDLQREGAVPLVSANVRPIGEAGPSIAQSFLREIGGIKIGITGAATPERFTAAAGVTALEYAPAVRGEVRMLRRRGAELIVVLAHVGEAGARELAEAVPEIDVIIRAPGTPIGQAPTAPVRLGNVIILEAGSQGQHVGRLTLHFAQEAPHRPIRFDDGGLRVTRERALTERKIRAYRHELEEWKKDPSKAEAVAAREAQISRLETSLEHPAGREFDRTQPYLSFDLIPLTEDVAADPDTTELLAAYYARLKDMNGSKGDVSKCASEPGKATFVGSARCAPCHQAAHRFWLGTKHARAWATLESQNKHYDLTCVGCHSVGYQRPGGFCRVQSVGELKDVGCENCHGPGSLHAATGEKSQIRLAVSESTCAGSCHVSDHSDTFDYTAYLLRVTGEGHRLRSLR